MTAKATKSVPVDFISQISDLRKREAHLLEAQFFGPDAGTPEGRRIRKELRKTRNALQLVEGLEVSPD